MKKYLFLIFFILLLQPAGWGESATVRLKVTPGDSWVHKFKVMPFFSVKTRPQMAFWSENASGKTLVYFVTEKFGKASWRGAPGDKSEIRRPSALPRFSYEYGKSLGQGMFLPDRNTPMPDTVTSATPSEGFERSFTLTYENGGETAFYFEVNHSTDFNVTYPKDADEEDARYSGGKYGSGQPALIYGVNADLSKPGVYAMRLLGHAEPSGKDGGLYSDLSGITTAADIVGSVEIIIEKEGGNDED